MRRLLLFLMLAGRSASEASSKDSDAAALTDASSDMAEGDAPADASHPRTLLWFGPHPDDELYLAPLLGKRCVDDYIKSTPATRKRIYTVPFDAVVQNNPLYDGLCAPSSY